MKHTISVLVENHFGVLVLPLLGAHRHGFQLGADVPAHVLGRDFVAAPADHHHRQHCCGAQS